MKKIIYLILLILWMIIIFMFSNQNGVKSQSLSDKFINNIISVSNKSMSKSDKIETISNISYLVRKIAHFSEYLILGILLILTLKEFNVKRYYLLSIIIAVIYASSDEVHQLFLVGRSAKVLDVFIDSFGSIVGILIVKLRFKKTILH